MEGVGFRVEGLGFRVQGLGYWHRNTGLRNTHILHEINYERGESAKALFL